MNILDISKTYQKICLALSAQEAKQILSNENKDEELPEDLNKVINEINNNKNIKSNPYTWGGLNIKSNTSKYLSLIYPNDNIKDAYQMGSTQSSCALVGLAYFRYLGFRDEELFEPYKKRISLADTDVTNIAKRHGIWKTKIDPKIGIPTPSVIRVCCGQHVIVALDGDGFNFKTVQGGKTDGGRGIEVCNEKLILKNNYSGMIGGRTVTGYADCSNL